jgi:serine/threonine-protein kinase HipA
MRALNVFYAGWGEHWLLGRLADDGRKLLFEYSPEALRQKLELSPLHLKLRAEAYGDFPPHLYRLPGLIADALPDGWGLLLMDRLFRQRGLRTAALSPLDRLAFIGNNAMGALVFQPSDNTELEPADMTLLALAQETHHVVSGKDSDALVQLARLGGSPQGARPKVLVNYEPGSGTLSTSDVAEGQPWLIKFQARGEHKEACALENLYARLARDCGLEMPETQYFDLGRTLSAFGVARFDRKGGLRVPIHTLASALHADFRLPSSVDYTTFLRATRAFTRDEREVCKAYERVVFNVLFHNRDDHGRNLAFCLGVDRCWRLAPAYDLTWSEGPGGEHQMDICGEGLAPGKPHLLRLAKEGGVDLPWATGVIERMATAADSFRNLAKSEPIRATTVHAVWKSISASRERLA